MSSTPELLLHVELHGRHDQDYDQIFYPRLVLALLMVLAAIIGLGNLCTTQFGKPLHVGIFRLGQSLRTSNALDLTIRESSGLLAPEEL